MSATLAVSLRRVRSRHSRHHHRRRVRTLDDDSCRGLVAGRGAREHTERRASSHPAAPVVAHPSSSSRAAACGPDGWAENWDAS